MLGAPGEDALRSGSLLNDVRTLTRSKSQRLMQCRIREGHRDLTCERTIFESVTESKQVPMDCQQLVYQLNERAVAKSTEEQAKGLANNKALLQR